MAGFFIYGSTRVKTRVYVDGYNFYYGCLKNTPYKWLDLTLLFTDYLLPRSGVTQSVLHSDCGIKFYTAEISPKVAEDKHSVNDQRSYHAALTNYRSGAVQVIRGSYTIDKVDSRKVELSEDGTEKLPSDCSKVKVWKLEEKQSDVNVALDAVFDAFCDPSLEHIVFVTNDTDIAPALIKLKELNQLNIRPPIKVGLVIPSKQRHGSRQGNRTLTDLADWTIHFIMESELASSQLPCRVTGGKKPALRPVSWFQYPEKVSGILDILSDERVCRSVLRSWRWLSEPKPCVGGLPVLSSDPSEMLHSKEGLEKVLQHVKAYADYKKDQQ